MRERELSFEWPASRHVEKKAKCTVQFNINQAQFIVSILDSEYEMTGDGVKKWS